jgi:SAM-dependent methyltransferase
VSAGERRLEGAADGVHARVHELVAGLSTRGKLLDAPCGAGALASSVAPLGFDVYGIDLEAHPQQKLSAQNFRLGNLDAGIPFDAGSFDVVLSVEGVEHLEAPKKFVRELARVLKPDGYLVISTPNILNVTSRWRFFTRGFHKHFTPDSRAQFSSGHLHAVDYVLLRQFLESANLEIVSVSTNQLLRGLRERFFGWLIRTFTKNKHPFAKELLSDELLYGQILIVVARAKWQSP